MRNAPPTNFFHVTVEPPENLPMQPDAARDMWREAGEKLCDDIRALAKTEGREKDVEVWGPKGDLGNIHISVRCPQEIADKIEGLDGVGIVSPILAKGGPQLRPPGRGHRPGP